jgi:eukaryotic-like serine/threonine-protein kinase
MGPYRIVRLLGRGGMGAVYEGVHSATGERSAIKILSLTLADDEAFRARFEAEIETLKQLQHPNIVRLIGYGEQDGLLFYSMELVEGTNLHDALLRQGRLPWQDVADIAIQVCAALKHAHDHGVIHRDLKPANLLRTEDGVVKLTDFGIAKFFGATHLTLAGGVIGTADYMSPEQAEGIGATPRSDLYSLGGVLYALLSGKPPFTGKSVTQILQKMKQHDPVPLCQLVPSLPVEFEEIVLQLLRRDPAERIATPLALSKRLRAMLHGLAAATKIDDESPAEPDEPTRVFTIEPAESPAGDDATVVGEYTLQPVEEPPRERWFEETVVTGPQAAPPQPAPAAPAADTKAGPSTHFTEVRRGRKVAREESEEATVRQWISEHALSTVAIVLGLLLLIALGFYFTRPPSADTLYARIAAVTVPQPWGDFSEVRSAINDFLEFHPDDPRREEVRRWQADHDAYRLWRRLERDARSKGGVEYLPPLQRQFVLASRELEGDSAKARNMFQVLLERYDAPGDNPGGEDEPDERTEDDVECLEAARHWTRRLP